MAQPGMQGRWLAVAGVIGLLVILSGLSKLLTPRPDMQPEPFTNRSVYNSRPSGYRAWHLAATRSGLPVTILRKRLADWEELRKASDTPKTLVIIEPHTAIQSRLRSQTSLSDSELDALLAWVKRGNRLVWIDRFDRKRAQRLLSRLGLSAVMLQDADRRRATLTTPDSAPAALTLFVERPVVSESAEALAAPEGTSAGARALLVDGQGRPRVLALNAGLGEVVIGSVPDLASNRYLHERDVDNFQWLTNLLSAPGYPVVIDEYVHGHNNTSDLLRYYALQTPVGNILIQLLFLFLLLLWWSSARWRPLRPQATDADAADIDLGVFVRSLATLYQRHHAQKHLAAPGVRRIETQLSRRYRLDFHPDDPVALRKLQEILAPLASGGETREESDAFVTAWRLVHGDGRQKPLPPEQAVSMTQVLARLAARLEKSRSGGL